MKTQRHISLFRDARLMASAEILPPPFCKNLIFKHLRRMLADTSYKCAPIVPQGIVGALRFSASMPNQTSQL